MSDVDNAEAERHRAKMEKRKAAQDAEVAEKTIEKGLLIVNTGPGKGNAMGPDFWRELPEVIEGLDADEEIRAIVESDFDTRLDEARPVNNVDRIVARILSGFDADVRQ